MIKVILADDNKIILERFTEMIDWDKYGFKIMSSAMDGKKAWNDFNKYQPELVITDIQMPKMTGIELAQKIIEISPDTTILFLTSYEEFSYVKSALDLGVYNYLLKHETDRDKLITILEEVKLKINKRRLETKYTEVHLYSLIEDINEKNISREALADYERYLPDKYDLILIEQDHIYPVISELFEIKSNEINERKVKNIISNNIPNLTAAIKLDKYKYIVLIKSNGLITELSYNIKKILYDNTQCTYSILIIQENSNILSCADKYQKSKDVMNQKYFNQRATITYLKYFQHSISKNREIAFNKISGLIKNNQYKEIYHAIDQYFLDAIKARDDKQLADLTRYFVSVLYSYHNKIIDLNSGAIFKAYDDSTYDSWYDAHSIYQWLKHKFTELYRIMSNISAPKFSEIVRQAIEYVNNNYTNSDLSVETIADTLKIHPNSLNAKFKKETGETIWKLIIKVRMDKAKYLLNTGNKKISEICTLTGYKNISYFSKVFKETYGMTPMEYRRKNNEI